jgi:hypothetical protein
MKRFAPTRGTVFDKPGRAIDIEGYDEVTIEGCHFHGTGGIFIQAKAGSRIVIRNNTVRNLRRTKDMEYANIQVSGLDAKGDPQGVVADILIAGNHITNEPGKCSPEDVINLIGVRGTREQRLMVLNNTIIGAYPADLSDAGLDAYDGCGVCIDRGTWWAVVKGNTIEETTNVGIGVAGGCYNQVLGNTITAKRARNVGAYIYNWYEPDPFKGNEQKNNKISWVTHKGRRDFWDG